MGRMRGIVMAGALIAAAAVLTAAAADGAKAGGGGRKAGAGLGPGGARREMTPEMKTKRMERLTKELGLSAEQQTAVGKILDERDAKLKALADDTTTDRKAKRQAMLDIQTKTQEELNKVLTADQQKKHTEMQEKMRERMKERMQNREQKGTAK